MMYTAETGLYPFAGLLVGGAFCALYVWVLKLRCDSRWAQAFIAVGMLVATVASVTAVARVVEVTPVGDGRAAGRVVQGMADVAVVGAEPHDGTDAAVAEPRVDTPDAETVARGSADTSSPRSESLLTVRSLLWQDAWPLLGRIYMAGVACVLLHFLSQLCWLLWLCRRYRCTHQGDVRIYHADDQPPFSFGRRVFMSGRLDDETCGYVLMHERAHMRHRHFLKLCCLQLLVAVCWYNPFVWLMFREMHLQQELEVDGDVLRQGIDRERYQLSLLRVCVNDGKWILLRSAFGMKPLKQRIIFMNKQIDKRSMRRRQWMAAACVALAVVATAVGGCRTRESQGDAQRRCHPMKGCWTMDWISNTGSGEEVHPVAMHYGFYNDSTFQCFSYWRRQGINMRFAMSGEGYEWRGDTLVDAQGHATDYTFTDERTVVSRWLKDSTQNAGVSGPDITEQWSRIEPCRDIVTVFAAASAACDDSSRPVDGVWQLEADEGRGSVYFIVNDTIFMRIAVMPSTVAEGFRYGASGVCGHLSNVAEWISLSDDDRLVMTNERHGDAETYRRISMPSYLLRAFAPAAGCR